ncbi:hypothetical protein [Streptomyces sp. MZ04]|uniref:hypothetical protein n=1 Tax=Streptomyces sp. MZ04 TaxID=2559236 RepID=UPI00107E7D2A|nr:hypothetical protein [Streptomyces sp. MZ04]TGB15479.1 hypothetical protein E2651_02285 [Streptomyces sp. MZ04]
MGTGSKSSHASYAVGPTAVAEGSGEAVAEASAQPMSGEEIQAKADLLMAIDNMKELIEPLADLGWEELPPSDPVERYEQFVNQVEQAQGAIEELEEAGASEEEVEAHTKALKAHTVAFLNSLDEDDLREIAAAKGFEHPALVGLSGKGQHPLVHWLDPAYPSDLLSKQKIQAAALDRYQQLLAGGTVGGLTLADYHYLEGTEPPVSGGSWSATPGEVLAAGGDLADAISAYKHAAKYTADGTQGEALQAMLAAEHKVATVDCPELGEELDSAKAKAASKVGHAINLNPVLPSDLQPLVEQALATGDLTETEAKHLTACQLVTLLRTTTPETEVTALKDIAVQRQDSLADLDAAYAAHSALAPGSGESLALPPAGEPAAPQKIAVWAENAGELQHLQQATKWYTNSQQALSGEPFAEHPGVDAAKYVHPESLTNDFKAWAKGQKLADLRTVAGEMGLDNSAQASRAQVQNYIAASFNPKYDQEDIKEKVAAATAKKAAAKAAAPAAKPGGEPASDEAVQALASKLPNNGAGAASNASVKPAAPPSPKPVKAPKPGSFNANIQALMAEVQHAKATSQDVPTRIDAKEVAGWTFGPGTKASNLGGTYVKTVHDGPDGSKWLFKTDHNHGGALGHTEAAASHVLSLGGVPAVPVYHHKQADGTAGCVQPLLQGAKPFTSSPSQWSQSQVDAIVRSHVGSWFIGEHDGHQDNWLETPSGGLVQVDRGQAWKHFGQDKLSIGYAPSGGGGFTPVHQKLYQAALEGGLAKGVKINPAAAHPVIKKFESMPDAQLRSVLHSTAHEGAKSGVAWVPQMRSRAAKALKIPQSQVTHEQIADMFLDHAVERKNSLRQNFANFFVKQVMLPSGASLKHGGS